MYFLGFLVDISPKVISGPFYNRKTSEMTYIEKYITNKNDIIIQVRSMTIILSIGGHGGRVVTLSPPTSEAGVRSPSWPQVEKLVVACRWSAVYSTEP